MGKHGKDYSRFFWPLNLVPLVVADDLAEIADLEVKFRTTQDDAARQLALGMSGDMEEITALAHDDSLHPAQRLLAVRLAYPRWEADRPTTRRVGGKAYNVMPEGIR